VTAATFHERRPSPRTVELPMAFTAWEFIRGALIAWVVFNLSAPLVILAWGLLQTAIRGGGVQAWASMPIVVVYTPMFAAPWSLGALLLIGAPMAFLLGTALRRISYRAIHLAAFGGLGLAVGAMTMIVWQWWWQIPQPGATITYLVVPGPWDRIDWAMVALMAGVTATAVAFAWRLTSTWALRADVKQTSTQAELTGR